MGRIRMWTLGASLALLASTDWFVAPAPAGGGTKGPSVTLGKATAMVVVREETVNEKKQDRAFLEFEGDCKGKVTVRLQETPDEPMRRMPARPKPVWERSFPVDTGKSRTVEIGVIPANDAKRIRELLASTDGRTFVRLLTYGGSPDEPIVMPR